MSVTTVVTPEPLLRACQEAARHLRQAMRPVTIAGYDPVADALLAIERGMRLVVPLCCGRCGEPASFELRHPNPARSHAGSCTACLTVQVERGVTITPLD